MAIFSGDVWVPGIGTLIPSEDSVTVWFDIEPVPGDVSTTDESDKQTVKFEKGVYTKAVHYDAEGAWAIVTS